jgi:hypothetical protein
MILLGFVIIAIPALLKKYFPGKHQTLETTA